MRLRRLLLFVCLAASSGAVSAQPFDPTLFSGMRWRLVGPFRGGRVLAVTGIPGDSSHFYFGAVGGGVWRSDNAGRTWDPIFDSQPVASIGALAVAPSDPRVIYVGSGEADMRSDISYGNGMYRSSDGGKTWSRIGLEDTRQIGRIIVDPSDADRLYVAALGHGYGPNRERGVFRSQDGGKTWKNVLFKDENTGAIDLAIDPHRSKTLFAALWQTRRPPWNVYPPSNGPGSGLYRSTDGGETWQAIVGNGFPSEKLGRIGIAFAPSDAKRVYAIVDAKEGGLYASADGGGSWKRVSADVRIWERGWYFGGVTVDPKNPDVVYVCDTAMYRSTDGGKTFVPIKGAPGGDDYHQLWIDPNEPRRMILGSDQGAAVSLDGARTWSSWYNQPTAQFYHVATDDQFPYWIYGAQQDTGAAAIPSRTDYRSITMRDWREIAAGGESEYIVPDPKDPRIVWGGTVGRFDWRTLQELDVDPTLASPDQYRGEWTLPLAVSRHEPTTIYFGNQFLFRSSDAGNHWEKASPDLTRENPAVPATLDPTTAVDSAVKGPRRGVVYAIALSSIAERRIWCGTDDGLIWLSSDGAKNWRNVTPQELTPWSKVGIIEASHFDADTAYVAIDRHRLDDIAPHILRTTNGGQSWSTITAGIPQGSFVNVVREDPVRRGLLYAGTETGVFVSFDDGDHWQPLQLNLPNCSIRDIDVQHGDLVVATHGRSFWVLDDLSPLRQLRPEVASSDVFLFQPREAVRFNAAPFQGTPEPKDEAMGDNPQSGAVIDYLLRAGLSGPLTLEILDAGGEIVRRYSSDTKPRLPDISKLQVTPDWVPVEELPPAAAGMHRFVWDLHASLPAELAGANIFRESVGPLAPPGRYTVRVTAGGKTVAQPLVVVHDPRLTVSDADLERQYELARDIESQRVRVAVATAHASALQRQTASLKEKARGEAAAALEELSKTLSWDVGPATWTPLHEFLGYEASPTSLRRVASSLDALERAIESADAAPTADALTGFSQRRKMVEASLARWQEILSTQVPKVNRSLTAAGLAPLAAE